jgi:hypothetical protein
MLQKMFSGTMSVFENNQVTSDHDPDWVVSSMCSLHTKLSNQEQHNSVACNYADCEQVLGGTLKLLTLANDLPTAFMLFYSAVNPLVERIRFLCHAGCIDYGQFKAFVKIGRWTNFHKHPKSFVYVHHPSYSCSDHNIGKVSTASIVINTDFVMDFYHIGADRGELDKRIRNRGGVTVDYPCAVTMLTAFYKDQREFVRIVCQDPSALEKLSKLATLTSAEAFPIET